MTIKFKMNSNTYLRASEIPFSGTSEQKTLLVAMTQGLEELARKKLERVSVSPNTTIEISVNNSLTDFSGSFMASGMVDDIEGEAIRQALKQS